MSKQTAFPKYDVLGVIIDAVTIADATRYICDWAADPNSPACYVAKPYSEFIDGAARVDARKAYLNDAQLCLADGVGVCWATVYRYGGGAHWWRIISTGTKLIFKPRSAYQFLPEKFAGPNATWPLLEQAQARNLRVFLMGSPHNSSIARTGGIIRDRLPNIQIVGTTPGEIGDSRGPALLQALEGGLDVTETANMIAGCQPDLILIGMGFPLQEALMSRLQPLLKHGVMIGEGGTFDYDSFGGSLTRAPRFIQVIGLEWLWRLMLETSRWRRQLAIPRLIWRVWREPRPPAPPSQ